MNLRRWKKAPETKKKGDHLDEKTEIRFQNPYHCSQAIELSFSGLEPQLFQIQRYYWSPMSYTINRHDLARPTGAGRE